MPSPRSGRRERERPNAGAGTRGEGMEEQGAIFSKTMPRNKPLVQTVRVILHPKSHTSCRLRARSARSKSSESSRRGPLTHA